ncbi:MAG: glycosyltransferase family 2 protein [Rhodoferax sp.]|nr:glycosyltransferase family 2 protein [Rhodoferax sp.]
MPTKDLISVVITTYNRSDALAAVLQGLSLQDDRGFEVVIADDGSGPEHVQAAHAAALLSGLNTAHVWHPDVGFTASKVRNRGVSIASGDYIVLMDGDCVPEVDFIRRHRQLQEHQCFVNGSRVMLSPELTEAVVHRHTTIFGRGAVFWLGQRLRGHASKLTGLLRLPDMPMRKHKRFVWRGIRSCNMGVWRTDYEAVNGFDESFTGWGHEDADFVLRLHHAGLIRKNGFCATEVFHLWHKESSRTQESENAQRVRDRVGTGQVQATLGYKQSQGGAEMVVTRLR